MKGKPAYKTQGQAAGRTSRSPNRKDGGAPGQKVSGTRNKPCEPHMGVKGQPKAGKS